MNYQIERTDNSFNAIKQNFNLIIEEIKKTEDINFINETIDKVKLAKEWAKIQKKTEEMYGDLIRIEIECYRRIVQLDCINVLPSNKRSVAEFYANMTEGEIENLINTKPGCSAIKIYRDYGKDYSAAGWRNIGISLGRNDIPENEKDFIEEIIDEDTIKHRIKEIAQYKENAVAFLLDHYASEGKPFTIEEMADNLLSDVIEEIDYVHQKEMKRGIREVCREAVSSAKTLFFKDIKMPRFVTCTSKFKHNNPIEWIRIPFENAHLSQFQEMIDLRKVQLEQDTKALENLIRIYELLNESYNTLVNTGKLKVTQKILIKDILALEPIPVK